MSDTDDFLQELARLPTFHHPTVSPAGSQVAFYYDETGRNELYVLDVETGEKTRISDGDVPRNARWFPRWDADGNRVFFHQDEEGDEQNDIHAIDCDGDSPGGAEPIITLDGQTILGDITADGESVFVQSSASGQMNIHRHDLESGETTQLTDYDRAVWSGFVSPDGEQIAYATNETDNHDNRDVYVADADGSSARNLDIGETGAEAFVADWGPDGNRLLITDNTEDHSRCGIYDLRTDEIEWYGEGSNEEGAIVFLPDGERFLAHRTRRASVRPLVYEINEDGTARELDLPDGVSTFPDPMFGNPVLSDDRVLLTHTTPDHRPELLVYDLTTDEYEVLLAAEYGDFDPDRFVDAEYFRFESHDGLEIGGLLYDSGERPSPLIVNPHGGPRGADHQAFGLYTQFLVSRGYSVLQVNYRGSTGRGREFVELLIDDWGGDEQADIAAATEYVCEFDWIDEDRVAVYGGSYGGYSANMQMLQYPELYAAGVSKVGLSDLRDMYENSMPHFKTELMEKYLGTPDENPTLYEERSPVTHAENLDVPLMIVHGVNDSRVPISQARLFREALEDAGYEPDEDFEYVELGAEGHGSTDIDQKVRTLTLLDEFLERQME